MLFEEKEKSIEKLIKIRTDQKISEYDAQAGFRIDPFRFLIGLEIDQSESIGNPALELFRKRKNFNCKTESGNDFKRSYQTGEVSRYIYKRCFPLGTVPLKYSFNSAFGNG